MLRTLDDLFAAIALALGRGEGELDLDSGMDVTEGWDSLKNMEIMLQVESAFGVKFTAAELMSMQSVRAIHAGLKERGLIS